MKKTTKVSNIYAITITNYRGPLRVVAPGIWSAHGKALKFISCLENRDSCEVIDICLVGPCIY